MTGGYARRAVSWSVAGDGPVVEFALPEPFGEMRGVVETGQGVPLLRLGPDGGELHLVEPGMVER